MWMFNLFGRLTPINWDCPGDQNIANVYPETVVFFIDESELLTQPSMYACLLEDYDDYEGDCEPLWNEW